jgi:hypothetical protein
MGTEDTILRDQNVLVRLDKNGNVIVYLEGSDHELFLFRSDHELVLKHVEAEDIFDQEKSTTHRKGE